MSNDSIYTILYCIGLIIGFFVGKRFNGDEDLEDYK